MGTRCIYTFAEPGESHHIFQHWDGYPSGVFDCIQTWIKSGLSWQPPRFEADEAACGFIAANKTDAGNYRLCKSRTAFCDVEYGYRIEKDKFGDILLTVSATDFWDRSRKETCLWKGKLSEFTKDIADSLD